MPSGTYISDLSEYGVFIHSDEQVPLGTKLKLRFTVLLDDPVIISAEGRVVRHQTEPLGMGLEFTDLDPETILRINDVVSRQRPRDSGPPITRQPDPAPSSSASGLSFKPPPMHGTPEVDETVKTGLFKTIDGPIVDEDS